MDFEAYMREAITLAEAALAAGDVVECLRIPPAFRMRLHGQRGDDLFGSHQKLSLRLRISAKTSSLLRVSISRLRRRVRPNVSITSAS